MKKVTMYVFFVLAIIIVVITLKIVAGYFFKNENNTQGLTQVGPKVNVLVIDAPGKKAEELLQHLDDGRAQLLLWVEDSPGEKKAYTFNTLESLVRLEKNNLGFLDNNDEGFKNLNVARYDSVKKVLYFLPLKDAHISSIEANRNYLIGEVLADPQNYKISAGIVTLSDGSKKNLYMIKVLEAQIQEARLCMAHRGKIGEKNELKKHNS